MKNTRYKKLLSVVMIVLMLASCATNATNATNTESDIAAKNTSTINPETESTDSETDGEYYPEAKYSDFDLNTSVSDNAVYVSFSGSQAETTGELEVGDGYIKIENGGDYVLSGDYSGQIIVESEENVHLILSGVTVYNPMSPIYVKSAKNVCITLATGTVNTISDSSEYTYEDGEDEPAAAVYSKADFTIPDRDFSQRYRQTSPEKPNNDNSDGKKPDMPSGDFTQGNGQTPPDKPAGDGTGDDSTSSGFGKGGFGGFGGFGRGGFNEPAEDGVYIKIFGGNITLSGGNDVLDSNGTLEITGGTITVNNPNMVVYGEPDCIIDVNGTAIVSGGTFIAYSSGASSASLAFTVPSITSSVTESGASVTVKDASGQTVIEIPSAEKCSTLYIASDKLTSGETYIVAVGSTTTEVTAQ